MKVTPTALPEVLRIEPQVFRDERGFFLETFRAERYREHGIDSPFVQDNHSRSTVGTLRGLHAQAGMAKLVRAVRGTVVDVAVDIRVGSPRFGAHVAVTLSEDNFQQLFLPAGFAHGFVVTSPVAEIEYKCSVAYAPEHEIAIAWNDPKIGITWPVDAPTLSARDAAALSLAEMASRCPRFEAAKP